MGSEASMLRPAGIAPRRVPKKGPNDSIPTRERLVPAGESPAKELVANRITISSVTHTPRLRSSKKYFVAAASPQPARFVRPKAPKAANIDRVYTARVEPKAPRDRSLPANIVITYRGAPAKPVAPAHTAVVESESPLVKAKKSSLIAKLQVVYKKPWDLLKTVGSKLR
jgi:hypothetical protein